jgi:outer membrane protein OmpA-like peptidoglycan-associated protein
VKGTMITEGNGNTLNGLLLPASFLRDTSSNTMAAETKRDQAPRVSSAPSKVAESHSWRNGKSSSGASDLLAELPGAVESEKYAQDVSSQDLAAPLDVASGEPPPESEVTRRTADADVTVRTREPVEPLVQETEKKEEEADHEEVTRQSAAPEFRKRSQGDELTRVSLRQQPPLPEAPKPLVPKEDFARRARSEAVKKRESGDEITKLSTLDPDKTGKLDGLPPFALIEKVKQLPADPESTNKFVRSLESEEDEDILPLTEAVKDLPLSASAVSPAPAKHPLASSAPSLETKPLASSPKQGFRFHLSTVIIINLITLLLGLAAGGLVVLLNLDEAPWLQRLVHPALPDEDRSPPREQDRLIQPAHAGATLDSISPATADASSPAPASDARDLPTKSNDLNESSSSSNHDAELSTWADDESSPHDTEDLQTATEQLSQGELPEIMWVPIAFPPGESRPTDVSREELRAVAEMISSSRGVRVELIGFTAPADGLRPAVSHSLALARAEAALDHLRSFGPSGRRFSVRAGLPDEAPPLELRLEDGLLRSVLFRVVQR